VRLQERLQWLLALRVTLPAALLRVTHSPSSMSPELMPQPESEPVLAPARGPKPELALDPRPA
jgi:hypothetical protein